MPDVTLVLLDQERRRWRRLGPALGFLAVALLLLAFALLEGDFPEELIDVRSVAEAALTRFGAPGSVVLLYIEESGIPLPVPGDVYVAYLGRISAGNWPRLIESWLAIIAAVVAGSTNLFFISRRWGTRFLEGPLARFLHIDRERLASAEAAFKRYGAVSIIFGRHIPGMRVPITVIAGVSRVRYPTFAASVAVSTAIWAGVWMWLAITFGGGIGHFFRSHSIAVGIAIAAIVIIVAAFGFRQLRSVK